MLMQKDFLGGAAMKLNNNFRDGTNLQDSNYGAGTIGCAGRA